MVTQTVAVARKAVKTLRTVAARRSPHQRLVSRSMIRQAQQRRVRRLYVLVGGSSTVAWSYDAHGSVILRSSRSYVRPEL